MSRITQPPHTAALLDEVSLSSQSHMLEVGLAGRSAGKESRFLLPAEFFNVFGAPADNYCALAENNAVPVRTRVSALAKAHSSHIILPLLERDGAGFYNRAYLIGPDGEPIGHYDKIHPTLPSASSWA